MWILLALFSTITGSFENVLIKRNTFHFNSYIITWALLAVSSLIYLPVFLISIHNGGWPRLTEIFWIAVVLRIIFDSIATVLYVKALKLAPVSLVVPMLAFGPIFIIFSSFFINHLLPSPLGIVGILIILLGVYYLNFDHDTKHIFSPFKAISKEKGILVMLLAVFIVSIVTSLKRLGIDNSNLYFYTSFTQIVWAICFTPVAYFSSRKQFSAVFQKRSIIFLLPIGLLDALQIGVYNMALQLSLPAYVGAIRSTSILFASFFAWIFFKEKLRERLLPILIIIIGIAIISFANGH